MHETAERLVEAVEQGRLSRRDAVGRLVALAAATFAGKTALAQQGTGATDAPTFRSKGLNHLALRVADVPRSRDFYRRHLGLETLRESSRNCFMAAGGNNFLALFRASSAGLDHFCFTIDDYAPAEVVRKLEAAGLEPERHEDRVYFDDPDGIQVQLASEWGDYPRRG